MGKLVPRTIPPQYYLGTKNYDYLYQKWHIIEVNEKSDLAQT